MKSLPPTLNAEENSELLAKAKAGDTEARELFFYHNMKLICFITSKLGKLRLSYEDRFSAAQIGFLKAYNTFDFERCPSFSSYAYRCMANEILMENRKILKWPSDYSFDSPFYQDDAETKLINVLVSPESQIYSKLVDVSYLRDLIEIFNRTASKRECLILQLRFEERFTQQQIAKILGVTRSYVSRIEIGLMKRFRKIASSLE